MSKNLPDVSEFKMVRRLHNVSEHLIHLDFCMPTLPDAVLESIAKPTMDDFDKARARLKESLSKSKSVSCSITRFKAYPTAFPRLNGDTFATDESDLLKEEAEWKVENSIPDENILYSSSYDDFNAKMLEISNEIADGLAYGRYPYNYSNGYRIIADR